MSDSTILCADLSDSPVLYAAVQNGVILNVYKTHDEALDRVNEEKQRDFLSIMFKRKIRKLLKRSGNVALHVYNILIITGVEEIK